MSTLAYAWEFGTNYGHIGSFLPLARALRARGHAIVWALAQTGPAAHLLTAEGFSWLRAPDLPGTPREGSPVSYNDILLRFGYGRAENLLGPVLAWRDLLRASRAEMVIANHAPTAILAARTLDMPVMLFCSAFCIPPRQRPLPNMRPWLELPQGTLEALEASVLASINAVLARFDRPSMDAVAELFDVAEDSLIGFPELDHYPARGRARYWGNLPDAGVGVAPVWPKAAGKRIFAYLRTETPHHEAALAALHALGVPALVYFPDAAPALRNRYTSTHLAFSAEPLDLAQVAREADAAVTYASMSTTTGFLLKGKPLLLLPGHLEQYLLARRVEEMGAGMFANPEQPETALKLKLERVVFEPEFALNAQAFAAKYANFSQERVAANLIRRIEQVVGAGLADAGQG